MFFLKSGFSCCGFINHLVLLLLFSTLSTTAFSQLEMVKQETMAVEQEQIIKQDPKLGFKSLFDEANESNNKNNKNINLQHINPQAMSFVQDYMQRHSSNLNKLQLWAGPYFDMMDDVLTQNGIPKQLKYLAVIESNLRATAVSWAGAVGPWQFMPGTARDLGLQVNAARDERIDYLKSTRAASKYLNQLFAIYKDWLLVVAAYNCGPGNVNSAISRASSRNFWNLQYYLPAETRNHVKKFIATHYIMEGRGGAATLTREEALRKMPNVRDSATHQNVKVQTIAGRYNSIAVAKYLEMSMDEFGKLNPGMDQALAANKTYELRLPTEKAALFLDKKNDMLNESIQMLLRSRL
ncbi:MAG: lytic transglycosylase domain-containing protein [Niabella sp.]